MKRTRARSCLLTHTPTHTQCLCNLISSAFLLSPVAFLHSPFSFVQRRMHKSILSHWRLFLPLCEFSFSFLSPFRTVSPSFPKLGLLSPPTPHLIFRCGADWHHLPLGNGIISLPFPRCSAPLDNSPDIWGQMIVYEYTVHFSEIVILSIIIKCRGNYLILKSIYALRVV